MGFKKSNILVIAIALCLFFIVGNAFSQTMSFTLQPGKYKILRDERGLDYIRMEGFSNFSPPGEPLLPYKVYNILLPPDVVWESLHLSIEAVETEFVGIYTIKPAVPDSSRRGEGWVGAMQMVDGKNLEVYSANASYPREFTQMLPYSQMRKWKFTKVKFIPFQYNPVTGELTLIKRLTIRINYTRSAEQMNQRLLQDTVMDEFASQMFINFKAAREWYRVDQEAPVAVTYDYAIITTSAIVANSSKLADFVAHKERLGHRVWVLTESTWGAVTGDPPNHKAEKIRKWLQNNYLACSMEYVLLIGDPSPYESGEGDVPMKMCWPRRGAGSDENSPTDYFYADLTGDWDFDDDQYYGEWTDDFGPGGGVDFSPEVYVGRIPVYGTDYTSLDSILQKIIDYETDVASIAWRKSIILPMGFQAAGYDGAMLGEEMRDSYLTANGFTSWRQYQQGSGACALDSTYASEEELRGGTVVRDRWAGSDWGIVCWWGHGAATYTIVGYTGCDDGYLFRDTYCSSLDDDHPSFTYMCSCTNGYPENSSNLQYAILKQGGIGTVSATRVSWFNTGVGYGDFWNSTTNSGIGYRYVERLTENEPAGRALYNTKASLTPESSTRLMNWYDFNLYGDPTTAISNHNSIKEAMIFGTGRGGDSRVKVMDQSGYVVFNKTVFGPPNTQGEVHVAGGDLDWDGAAEVVCGQGFGGDSRIKVFDLDGSVIFNRKVFGSANANGEVHVATGEVGGGGTDEIICGQGYGGESRVKVFDINWNVIFNKKVFGPPNVNGEVHVAAGDVDGDDVDEIICGQGYGGDSRVKVFELNGTVIFNQTVFGPPNANGEVHVGTGDVDGDGVDEIICGQGYGGDSRVKVFELSGSQIFFNQVFTATGNPNGEVHVAGSDVDDDGTDEIICAQGYGGNSRAKVFELNGSQIFSQIVLGPTNTNGEVHVGSWNTGNWLWTEDFGDGVADNWVDDGSGCWSVSGGVYEMNGTGANTYRWSYYNTSYSDFTYQADFKKVSGDQTFNMAIAFRSNASQSNSYFFGHTASGWYLVWKYVGGSLTMLQDWTQSAYLNTGFGAWNRLKVVCKGSLLTFYINDVQVASVVDTSFSSGYVGLRIYDSASADVVHIDNVRLSLSVHDSIAGTAPAPSSEKAEDSKGDERRSPPKK